MDSPVGPARQNVEASREKGDLETNFTYPGDIAGMFILKPTQVGIYCDLAIKNLV